MLSIFLQIWLLFFPLWSEAQPAAKPAEVYIRINQVGYRCDEQKLAIIFSSSKIKETYTFIDENQERVEVEGKAIK